MIQEFILLPSVEDYTTAHYFYPGNLRHPFAGGDMTTSLDFFRSSPGLTISVVITAILVLYLVPKMQVRKVKKKKAKAQRSFIRVLKRRSDQPAVAGRP